jgi:phosphate transport system permease protein
LFIILKGSFSNLLTGIILAISRASGETAPLLFTAFGNMYLNFNMKEPMATLPVQIYTYAISPFKDWQRQAWAGAFVLMVLILSMNLFARFVLTKIKDKKGRP